MTLLSLPSQVYVPGKGPRLCLPVNGEGLKRALLASLLFLIHAILCLESAVSFRLPTEEKKARFQKAICSHLFSLPLT